MLRKFGLAIAVAAMLVALPGLSNAADLPVRIPLSVPKGPLGSSIFGAGTGGGLVSFVAFGFLGTVAALCAYDIYLKIEGVKNWDGTTKVAQPHKHHHHAA